jgi:recombination associated protein RdgC
MWFKNLFIFAFTRNFDWSVEALEKQLAENKFTPCASTEVQHFGFVNALGKHGTTLAHESTGNILLCARKEEKILPAPVIKDLVTERVEALELEHSRAATKKEREQIKEDVIFELLPRAFSRLTDTHAYISPANNMIVVNTSSRGKAEDVLALLRKALGTLPVTSISPEKAPDEVMTEWLTQTNISDQFVLTQEAEFNALGDDGAVVRVKNQDLTSDEVKAHLDADKYVTKIGIEFDKSIGFVLTDDLSIKRLRYFDVLQEQNDDIDKDDVITRLDADFLLMANELNRMITNLLRDNFNVSPTDYLEAE